MITNTKYTSKDDALAKLQRYCVYQDRCHQEVRTKLLSLRIFGDDLEEVIVALIQDDFLNEERFAASFVRGKHRIKRWGRIKILQGLHQKNISAYCIKKGMQEIDEELYEENLHFIIEKRDRLKNIDNQYKRRIDLFNFARTKGYETPIINSLLNIYLKA